MMAARHLHLALGLILGLAGATKRPRGNCSKDDSTATGAALLSPPPSGTSTGTDPVIENTNLHLLKRVIQTTGCLFSDSVSCSGDFEDPMGHAVLLLSNILAKKHPEYQPVKSLRADVSSVEQLRRELARGLKGKRGHGYNITAYGTGRLQLVAAQKLLSLALWAGGGRRSLSVPSQSTLLAWDNLKVYGQTLSAIDEVFMAAEKTAARFDRSVFVWPSGQSGDDPLHPEEQLYAASVVVMCKRLGVRPVSVFLVTKQFERSLLSSQYYTSTNLRRPTVQVIAMAVGESVQGLDLAETCRGLVEKLGICEPLDVVPYMSQHRTQNKRRRELKPKSHDAPVLAGPVVPPTRPAPLVASLPAALQGDFAEADRLLLVRSIQLAFLLFNQAAVDQRNLDNLFFQASNTIIHLRRTRGHSVSSELTEHKPRQDFTPLDLLRVIAEADLKPDLSAVATVGDVMLAAAQMIFRHLYLALPVTVLAKVKKFNVVGSPGLHSVGMARLKDVLLWYGAPHVLSDSSTLADLYEETDTILWAAFRVLSKRRGNLSEAFVLCTREMSEKIPIVRQQAHYLIPAILWKAFDDTSQSVEVAVLNLLHHLVPVPQSPANVQMPRAIPQALDSGSQVPIIALSVPTITPQAATISKQVAVMSDQATSRQPGNSTNQILSKVIKITEILFGSGGILIQRLDEISSMVIPFLPTDLARAGELTSANRLVMTLQLKLLDAKLKRDQIPSSDTDHVTVLLDALVALHFLRNGAVLQLASFQRTRMSDISLESRDSLTRLLVAALLHVTSMWPAGGSMSAAFSELTKVLVSAVGATTSG